MSSPSVSRFCCCGFLTYLVLFSFYISKTSSVSLDLTELRNKVAKIKVNPRGNLWATGHFMGKKSVVDSKHLPTEDESTMTAVEAALNARQVEPEDVFQEMLRVALQTHLDTRHIRPNVPETAILMKILESYIQDNK
ncbi:neuromedin Bb precursor [Danio rerio]|uniref:Neuromedin Bb n=1 Tax=Danio rerio TaxID=7955 RepID=B3DFU2_DANRE|nr:neuromedin Bb [Danio rerio]AAI62165.1 Similar to neuromedin B [Danio rerio]AAI62178.1 Similar to neuromedin B [Danio rerio]|eukprot:NP_001122228.1 neuromedin Bb [Danio rerio]